MSALDTVRTLVQGTLNALSSTRPELLTHATIASQVDLGTTLAAVELTADEKARLIRSLEETFVITDEKGSEDGSALEDAKIRVQPWVPTSKPSLEWPRWELYSRYLAKGSLSPLARQDVDHWTDRILEKLPNPRDKGHEGLDVRGMVFGAVQSGKTSNYLGLLTKAADAGYRTIIVLAGMHENLRRQTQDRVDKGLVGRDTSRDDAPIGVGRLLQTEKDFPREARAILEKESVLAYTSAGVKGDISSQANPLSANHVQVFVMKKNVHRLRRFLSWCTIGNPLEPATNASGRRVPIEYRLKPVPYAYVNASIPLLIVDDECDQASIDTLPGSTDTEGKVNPNHDPTAINRLIRAILRCFKTSAYVGYTATPFANVLIHDEFETKLLGRDLFPRHFIVSLPMPQKYIGASRIFERSRDSEDLDEDDSELADVLIEEVFDHADDPLNVRCREGWLPPIHKIDHPVDKLSQSLQDAITDFTLAGAILNVRKGENHHHSMLIHCTRFTNVIDRLHGCIEDYWRDWRSRVSNGDKTALAVLKERFENSFLASRAAVVAALPWSEQQHTEVTWETLLTPSENGSPLQQAVRPVVVRQVHGGSRGADIDYIGAEKQGGSLKVIAVGGNKLSRGLTLEGLTTSYFLRTSRMYDTLMQMGRWFGYRPGYLDVCRLYMPTELTTWFAHIARASRELRQELQRMAARGATPEEFGLRVLSHSTMSVTSNVKMRHGEKVQISFSDSRPETINFSIQKTHLENNLRAVEGLVRKMGVPENPQGVLESKAKIDSDTIKRRYNGYIWRDIDYKEVCEFLDLQHTFAEATVAHGPRIAEYIRKTARHGEVTKWTVFIRHNPKLDNGLTPISLPFGLNIGRSTRSRKGAVLPEQRGEAFSDITIGILLDSLYEAIDLNDEEFVEALTLKRTSGSDQRHLTLMNPGDATRFVRDKSRGLLLIYLVQPMDRAEKDKDGEIVKPRIPVILPGDLPLVGFGISFPRSETDEKVEYIVSNIWAKEAEQAMWKAEQEPDDDLDAGDNDD